MKTVKIIKNFYKEFNIYYEVDNNEIDLIDVHSRDTGSILLFSGKKKLEDLEIIINYIKDLLLFTEY